MTLRTQLILAFGIVAAIPLVGGAIGIFAQRLATRQARELAMVGSVSQQRVAMVTRAQVAFRAQVSEWQAVLFAGSNQAAYEAHLSAFRRQRRTVEESLQSLESSFTSAGADRGKLDALRAAVAALNRRYDEAMSRLKQTAASSSPVSLQMVGEGRGPAEQFDALRLEMVANAEEAISSGMRRLSEKQALMERIMIGGTVVGILLGVFFGWMTSNAVVQHLRSMTGRMQERTAAVASAANQVSASSASVASTSSEQATTIESSSAAISQVSVRVKENAARAREAQRVSEASRVAAEGSASEIEELQNAMHASVAAAGNITKIIKSIDEIAFQTNLLALNAAVEAARAGDAGAGFAVVADEVRSLAQRSAKAARETADRIEDASAKSTRGAELADRVGKSLRGVLENTRTVDTLVREIAQASVDQAAGLEHAVDSMEQIDRLTQSNASSAEETAAAAEALNAEAGQLRKELASLLERRAQLDSATAARGVVDDERKPLAA